MYRPTTSSATLWTWMAADSQDLVVFGNDLLNAYRQWPVRVPAQCGTFLTTRHGVTFWYHLAMNFGATASVWNFNRGADALQQLSARTSSIGDGALRG